MIVCIFFYFLQKNIYEKKIKYIFVQIRFEGEISRFCQSWWMLERLVEKDHERFWRGDSRFARYVIRTRTTINAAQQTLWKRADPGNDSEDKDNSVATTELNWTGR